LNELSLLVGQNIFRTKIHVVFLIPNCNQKKMTKKNGRKGKKGEEENGIREIEGEKWGSL